MSISHLASRSVQSLLTIAMLAGCSAGGSQSQVAPPGIAGRTAGGNFGSRIHAQPVAKSGAMEFAYVTIH